MMELEEIKKHVDEAVRHKRDLSMSFTVLDAQLKNLKTLIAEAEATHRDLQSKNRFSEDTFRKTQAERIEQLGQKEAVLRQRESELSEALSAARGEQNRANLEVMRAIALQEEAKNLKSDCSAKMEKFKEIMEIAKGLVG